MKKENERLKARIKELEEFVRHEATWSHDALSRYRAVQLIGPSHPEYDDGRGY